MQFHLDGFRPGDPDIKPAAGADSGSEVDVLIVGCGPAGLTLAAQLSAFPSIRTRIVEQRDGPMKRGQADGISVRSMEMFQAFGFAHRVMREAYWVNETTFWKPDPDHPGQIVRTGRVQDVEDGLSEMPHVILNQARVHDMYLEVMRNSPRRLEPDYSRKLTALTVSDSGDYPVTATLERVDEGHEGETETIRARYAVGCDGARSAVRAAIGRELRGDSANQAWGVMDVLAVTDFPDIRFKSLIQSQSHGNIVLIPREGGYLARFYIELDKLSPDERVRNRNITVEHLTAAANRILSPYTLDVKEVAWWSVYEIGQRLTDRFDDAGDEGGLPRVFICGDACHTHSPKAGQGMNVSMGDGLNLGWKLAAVLEGRSSPDLLRSYSDERQGVAQDLIDFDKEWNEVLAAKPEDGQQAPRFQEYFIQHGRYTAGTAVRYAPSVLTGDGRHQHLASGFEIGTRFHSAPVTCLADAKPVELGHCVLADGRWRVFAFADSTGHRLKEFCDFLARDTRSPVLRHTPQGADPDAVIDVRAILQQPHCDVDASEIPTLLRPAKGCYRLIDYEKVFCPSTNRTRDIFDMRGIDRAFGCVLVVRPDQYVANVLPLDGYDQLAAFFGDILL